MAIICNTSASAQPTAHYSPKQAREYLDQILSQANATLKSEGIEVLFMNHLPPSDLESGGIDPKCDLMLGIRTEDRQEPIDIFDLKTFDKESLKPQNLLVDEVIAKVRQHLAANKTKGILITLSGAKLDTRYLEHYSVSVDDEGYLCIENKCICIERDKKPYVLPAEKLHSYTLLRFFYDEPTEKIIIVDEYDLVRENNKTMAIDITLIVNNCYQLERPLFDDDLKQRCSTFLQQILFT